MQQLLSMIGAQNKSLPTKFAVMLAISCDLYVPEDEETGNEELWYELRDRLSNFQKMALATDFKTSIISYYGMELAEYQVEILRIIHENTKKWLVGHVAEVMLDNLEKTSRTNHKDKREIAELFLEHFLKDQVGDPKEKKQREKGLIVKYTDLPEDTQINYEEH